MKIKVNSNDTLINIIKNKLNNISNKTIKQYFKYNMILLNNKVIKNDINVNVNDIIEIKYDNDKEVIDFDIIYEDNDIIVINKPCKLLSVSNRKEKERTAFNLVYDYLKKKDKNSKLFVVHRLDEETSGILMFTKNERLRDELYTKWNEIVKTRVYYAVVPFKMPNSGVIESYLTMNHNQIVYSTKNKEIGNYAKTNYKVINYKNGYSLVKVNIDTGKRNQIRVHMSENFKPIVGDKKYGSKDNSINRLALHANKLELIDPRNNKLITFESKIPECMLSLLNKII